MDQIVTPLLKSERTIDATSIGALADNLTAPGMTDREKAEAAYRFFYDRWFHWPSPMEGHDAPNWEIGNVFDPIKLLNVYGQGYCNQGAALLEALWEAMGLEARSYNMVGHTVPEVHYDGAWHMYDGDLGLAVLNDRNAVASVEDLFADPSPIADASRAVEPYLPFRDDATFGGDRPDWHMGEYAFGGDRRAAHDRYWLGHRMHLALRPGERIVRYFEPRGKWMSWPKFWNDRDGLLDFSQGPIDVHPTGKTYGNGDLIHEPSAAQLLGAFETHSELQATADSLRATGSEGSGICRVHLPYLIVGRPMSLAADHEVTDGAMLKLTAAGQTDTDALDINVSSDGGLSWSNVISHSGTGETELRADFTSQVHGTYGYLLQVNLTGTIRVTNWSLITSFLCAPLSLPAVGPGSTRMEFSLGDGTEMLDIEPDLRTQESLELAADSCENVLVRGDGTDLLDNMSRVRPADSDAVAHVTFKVEAPPGATIEYLTAGGLFSCHPHDEVTSDCEVQICIGDETVGRSDPVWRSQLPDWAQKPYFQGYVTHSLSNSATIVYIQFRLVTRAALGQIRIKAFYRRTDASPTVPTDGLEVCHAWQEGDTAHEHREQIRATPHEYTVLAGSGTVRNVSVEMRNNG